MKYLPLPLLALTPSLWSQVPSTDISPKIPDSSSEFGYSMASGDFDGDGLMDVAYGRPGSGVNGNSSGAVEIQFGDGSAMLLTPPNPIYDQANGRFGHALAS